MLHKNISNKALGICNLNKFDDEFMSSIYRGEVTTDQAISIRIIKLSVHDYLFFGLGKNGITPERFLEAYLYLFKVRGQDPSTWDVHTIAKSRRVVSPDEIKAKCFDTHYDLSGVSQNMDITIFLNKLVLRRTSIVNDNLKQITTYMSQYRVQEWKRQPEKRKQGKHAFPRVNLISTLTYPNDCQALARLYLFGRSPNLCQNNQAKTTQNHTLNYKRLLF